MNLLRELVAICRLEWQRLRATPRIVILGLFYLLSGGLLVLLMGMASSSVQQQMSGAVNDPAARDAAIGQMRMGVLGLLFDTQDPGTLEALARVPLVVFVGFRAALYFLPVWVALLGFDGVSEELSTRSIRYLSVRARRSAVVLGKFVALGTVLGVVLLLLTGGLVAYGRYQDPAFTGVLWVSTWARCFGAAWLFALGYLGLTLLCSTLVAGPALALAINVMALFGFWVVNLYSEHAHRAREAAAEDAPAAVWGYLRLFTPSHHGPALLDPDPSRMGTGAAAFAGFIIVFVGAACLLIERRDL